jgi:hypothetical protein
VPEPKRPLVDQESGARQLIGGARCLLGLHAGDLAREQDVAGLLENSDRARELASLRAHLRQDRPRKRLWTHGGDAVHVLRAGIDAFRRQRPSKLV